MQVLCNGDNVWVFELMQAGPPSWCFHYWHLLSRRALVLGWHCLGAVFLRAELSLDVFHSWNLLQWQVIVYGWHCLGAESMRSRLLSSMFFINDLLSRQAFCIKVTLSECLIDTSMMTFLTVPGHHGDCLEQWNGGGWTHLINPVFSSLLWSVGPAWLLDSRAVFVEGWPWVNWCTQDYLIMFIRDTFSTGNIFIKGE